MPDGFLIIDGMCDLYKIPAEILGRNALMGEISQVQSSSREDLNLTISLLEILYQTIGGDYCVAGE